ARHVEPPRLGQSMIRRQRCGGDERLDLGARDRAVGEPLDRSTILNRLGSSHGLKLACGTFDSTHRSVNWKGMIAAARTFRPSASAGLKRIRASTSRTAAANWS